MKKCRITVGRLIDLFLPAQEACSSKRTANWYASKLHTLRIFCGEKLVDEITAATAHEWIRKHYAKQSESQRHAAGRAVSRLCSWAADERLIDHSPLTGFRKPPASNREICLSPAQYALCVRLSRGPLRQVIKFLWHTGCRPGECRILKSAWISGHKVIIPRIDSKGKRRRRIIYLNGMAYNLSKTHSKKNPTGPIFRNNRNTPWTDTALADAIARLRDKTEIEGLCAYAFRHSWITRMLQRGVDVATVAAMAGNSPEMVLRVYNHVCQDEDRILRQLG